ncbi:MAG: nuclear transport factor 2 family protein [Pseudomonadota bacterium]
MNLQDIQSIEWACSKLCNQFAVFNDAGRHDELADLFIEDGEYARPLDPENFVVGKAGILAGFKARPKDKVFRHLITNIVIDVTAANTATGICYVTLFSGSTNNPAEKLGLKANPSVLVGEYHDEFVLTDPGWRFSRRAGRLIFTT